MFTDLEPDQWDYLISPRDGLLDAAIREFSAADLSEESSQRVQSLWDTLTSTEFRAGLDECCLPFPGCPFPKAEPTRLFDNARSRFAAGVAVGLLSHLHRGPQVADGLRAWLARAALLPATQQLGVTADLLSIPWSDNQEQRLAQLLALIPSEAGFDPWRVRLHLYHWLHPHQVLPTDLLHRLRVPIAAVSSDHREGFILELSLAWLPSGKPGLIEHPVVWNCPVAGDWLEVMLTAHNQVRFQTPVVWGLNSEKRTVLQGDSHAAAAQVACRVLGENGDYDTGCLLAATLSNNDAGVLDGVSGLDKKCQAAQAAGINRVVIAQQFSPGIQEISPAVADKLVRDAFRPMAIHRLGTLEAAYEEATGLARGLRMYLTWLAKRMDEESPAYLGLDRNGDRRLLSRYYIEPDILKTEIRKPTQAEEHVNAVPLSFGVATEAEEVTTYRHFKAQDERRVAWQREWPRLPPRSRVAIVGLPGEGKTLLTQMTVRVLAKRALDELQNQTTPAYRLPLPVWLRLRDVVTHGSIQEAVRHSLQDGLPNLPAVARNFLTQNLVGETAWIFLDALDEVSESSRPDLSALLRRELNVRDDSCAGDVSRLSQPCRVILTSRPWGFAPEQLPFHHLIKYQLAPLNLRQRNHFIRTWFEQSVNQQREAAVRALIQNYPSLAEVARTPLLLTLTCSVADDQDLDPDQVRRVILYKLVIRKILRGESKPAKTISEERVEDQLLVLAEAAWKLFRPDPATAAFTLKQWYAAIESAGVKQSKRASVFNRWRTVGLLISTGVDKYKESLFGMPHRSFIEHTAASHASRLPGVVRDVQRYLWQERENRVVSWQPEAAGFLTQLAGLLNNPCELLECIIELHEYERDSLGAMARLANHCLAETTIRNVPSELARRISLAGEEVWISLGASRESAAHLQHEYGNKFLVQVLRNRDAEIRRSAVIAFGACGTGSVAQLLSATLNDPSRRVVIAAINSLGEQADTNAVDHIIPLLTTRDEEIRSSAIHAIAAIGSDKAVEALLSALKDRPSPSASLALRNFQNPRACDILIQSLQNSSARKIDVIESLGALSDSAAIGPLTDCLSDTNPSVRGAALMALGELADRRAVSDIIKHMADPDEDVPPFAVRALGDIGGEEAVTALYQLVGKPSSYLCEDAINALGRLQDPGSMSLLAPLVSHSSVSIRSAALTALGQIADFGLASTFVQAYQDKSVAKEAAIALSRLGDRRAIPLLIELLRKESGSHACLELGGAIGSFRERSVVPDLVQIMHSDNSLQRLGSIQAMSIIRDPASVKHLMLALNDPLIYVRAEAAQALCNFLDVPEFT